MICIVLAVFLLVGCTPIKRDSDNIKENISGLTDSKEDPIIYEEGLTLEARIQAPKGFERIEGPDKSIVKYLRNLELKPHDSPVFLYNGNKKLNDRAHIAVFDFDIGTADLQQCADSIIRVYAEYFWSLGTFDKIQFHLTNGFLMEYSHWRDGKRIEVQGNNVKWVHKNAFEDSYECFRNYLTQVYIYAGTLSLTEESESIPLEEIQVGDFFIKGGSPGHCVLVVDIARDSDGQKCFLLAQGYMPAQDFHVLNNPLHLKDPWYYEAEIKDSLQTAEYTFETDNLRRWNGFIEQ